MLCKAVHVNHSTVVKGLSSRAGWLGGGLYFIPAPHLLGCDLQQVPWPSEHQLSAHVGNRGCSLHMGNQHTAKVAVLCAFSSFLRENEGFAIA